MYHKQSRKNSKITSPKTQFIRWAIFVIVALFLSVGAWIGYTMYTSINKITADSGKNSVLSLFDTKKMLKGQTEGRTNVLLLGYGGSGHAGGDLSDTMVVLSIDWTNNKMAMISVPRDLWVNIPSYGYSRINKAFSYGNMNPKVSGGGGKVASDVIGGVLGIPIHYFVAMDFNGFVSIVNSVGGVDIKVENTFTDYAYPKSECNNDTGVGCSLMTVHFDSGIQHMDGARALIYSRSRHSLDNNEGIDFARSRRQQLLMLAIKNKILSLEVLANPLRITGLLTSTGNHLKTSLQVPEIKSLFDEIKKIDTDYVVTKVIDNSLDNGVLKSMTTDAGADVQIPKKGIGVYTDLQTIAKNIFLPEAVVEPNYKIEVLNGTGKTGVATKISQTLKTSGYTIYKIGNSATVKIPQTVIYNCVGPTASATTKKIATILSGVEKTKTDCGVIDIQILVGESSL